MGNARLSPFAPVRRGRGMLRFTQHDSLPLIW